MLYFAYGSNMNPEQMKKSCPNATAKGIAKLDNHKLTFPRLSSNWGGGIASVDPKKGSEVWGVLYEVSEDEMRQLDESEGYLGPENAKNVYERVGAVAVVHFGALVQAVLYEIAYNRGSFPPSRKYLDTILAGARAHGLPAEYITMLEGIQTTAD